MDSNLYYRAIPFTPENLKGSFENLKIEDGYLCLDNSDIGVFISEPTPIPECDTILVSWNCYRRGGSVEMSVSYRKSSGEYSDFFSFGEWETLPKSKSVKTAEGVMDEDTLKIPERTSSIIIKAVLTSGADGSGDPRLLRFAAAHNGKGAFDVDVNELPEEVSLDVPPRSQMAVPVIGHVICSPTSTSMCMDYQGVSLPTADVAALCFDHGAEIYGNWLFNVAAAGEQGFDAHFDMYDIKAAMKSLANGVPLAFSIRTEEGQISNAPQAYVNGHLICVTGYRTVNGRLYFKVNDPACGDVADVRREYDAEQLSSGWKLGAVYVIKRG